MRTNVGGGESVLAGGAAQEGVVFIADADRERGSLIPADPGYHVRLGADGTMTPIPPEPYPGSAHEAASVANNGADNQAAHQELVTVPVDAKFMATTARDMKVREAYAAPDWITTAYNTALQQAVDDETITPLLFERLTSVRDAMLARYTPEHGMVVADKAYARVLEAARDAQQSDPGAIVEAIESVHRPGPSRLRLAATRVGHAIIGNLAFGLPSERIDRAVAGYADGHRLIRRFADALRDEVYRQSLQLGRDTRQSVQARLKAVALNDGARFLDDFNGEYGDGAMSGQEAIQALRAGGDFTIQLRPEVTEDEQRLQHARRLLEQATAKVVMQEADYDRLTSWLNDNALEGHAQSLGDIYARYLLLEDERLLQAEPRRLRPLVTFARRFVA